METKKKSTSKVLRRYTDLGALLHMLKTRQITFLDPQKWEDRNDAYYMEAYKRARKLQSLLALCFSDVGDTFHHWKTFSPSANGACVVFDKSKFLPIFEGMDGVTRGLVKYYSLKKLSEKKPPLSKFPFVKRWPYKPESEYRIVWESSKEQVGSLPVEFPLDSIREIVLSPWSVGVISDSVRDLIRSIDGCEKIAVNRSTLISNETWQKYADGAVKTL